MIWNDDMDAVLITGWNTGLSSFEIAALIGLPTTASAVRGRRVDLGLPARTTTTTQALAAHFMAPALYGHQPGPQDQPGPWRRSKPFADRGRWECAFIVSETDAGMCACCGPVRPGSRRPYCDFHHALTARSAHAA